MNTLIYEERTRVTDPAYSGFTESISHVVLE